MSRVLPGWLFSLPCLTLLNWAPKWMRIWGRVPSFAKTFWHHTTYRVVDRYCFPCRSLHQLRRSIIAQIHHRPDASGSQPQVGGHEGQEYHGDHAIHGKESGIEAAKVARRNDRVLIGQ